MIVYADEEYQEDRPYSTEVNDLAFIIAQMTSGIKGALPEQDDFELAKEARDKIQELISDYYEY